VKEREPDSPLGAAHPEPPGAPAGGRALQKAARAAAPYKERPWLALASGAVSALGLLLLAVSAAAGVPAPITSALMLHWVLPVAFVAGAVCVYALRRPAPRRRRAPGLGEQAHQDVMGTLDRASRGPTGLPGLTTDLHKLNRPED